VAAVDTSKFKDIAIGQAVQAVDRAGCGRIKVCAASLLVQGRELQRMRGKDILRSLAKLVFFLLCRE
jgi:hypothetical protein